MTKTELAGERERREAAEARLKELRAQLDEFAKVEETNDRIVVTLTGEVLFATDESTLRGPATARLAQVSEALLADRDRRVTVVGHTDSQGSDSYNQRLSQDRANAVRTTLISQGIAADRITAVGQGEAQPVAPNDTADGRAQNRRVEIIIDKTAEQASR